MPEFLTLTPPADALATLLGALPGALPAENVALAEALGRVTAAPVIAPHPLPAFARSTVDGFAVRAADTFGASDAQPAYLKQAGEVPMGAAPGFVLGRAACALIHTGGMLPAGADAVVMVEYTQPSRADEVEILRAAALGENIIQPGEDVAAGELVIPAGTRLRAAELGGLAALGIVSPLVSRRPRVAILSSGDEVIPAEQQPQPGQVRDVNAYTLSALVTETGGLPVNYGIIRDDLAVLQAAAAQALAESDVLVITAGSSASTRDLTAQVVNSLGKPGVLVHGVNVRPGKPTILGVCAGKAVIGLPGNPVSALVIARLFVAPVIEKLSGLAADCPRPTLAARLALNVPSSAGREDWVPVRVSGAAGSYTATPVFGKSNLIFTLARAHGLVRIPANATGLEEGALVEVTLL